MSRIATLRQAGFSDDEVTGYVKDRWSALEQGGFNQDEIQDYFGIDPDYQAPGAGISAPIKEGAEESPTKQYKPETPFQKVASMYAEAGLRSKADTYYMMAGLGRFMGHDFGNWINEQYLQAARESEELAGGITYDPESVLEKIDKKIVDGALGLLNPKLALMGVPSAYGGAEFLTSYGRGGNVPQAMIDGAKSVIIARAFGKAHGMGKAEAGAKMGTLGAVQAGSEAAMQNLNPEDVAYASLEGFTTMGIFGAMSGGKLSAPAQRYYQRTKASLGEDQAMTMAKSLDQALISEVMNGAKYDDVVERLRMLDEDLVPPTEKEKASLKAREETGSATVQPKGDEAIQEGKIDSHPDYPDLAREKGGSAIEPEPLKKTGTDDATLGSGLGGAQDIYDQAVSRALSMIKEGREEAAVAMDAYEATKDVWIGHKDERILRARVESGVLQREIRQALGAENLEWYRAKQVVDGTFERHAREIDQAIQIKIELERFPEKKAELWDKLTDEQKRIVDLSENLTPELEEIAERIKQSNADLGLEALDAEIIRNVRENYVAHIWDLEGKPGESSRKFGTTTGHAKARTFDTILDGWAAGYELKVKGATNALRTVKEDLIRTMEDKRFLDAMSKVKTIDGDPLISPYRINDDYVEIQHGNFKKWKYAAGIDLAEKEVFGPANLAIGDNVKMGDQKAIGKITAISDKAVTVKFTDKEKGTSLVEIPIKNQAIAKNQLVRVKPKGQNFIIQDDGTVLERVKLYAPKHVAKDLNNILGVSKLNEVPGIKTITKYNAQMKAWILQSSLFHHQAFMRSYYLGTSNKTWEEMNVLSAYKAGLQAIEAFQPELMLGVRKGLTLGIRQDWEESLLREKTIVGRGLDAAGVGEFKDKILQLRDMQADYLFNDLGSGLKAKAFLIEHRDHLRRNPGMDPEIAAEQVATLINADFGGLNLQRMGRNPTMQHIMRLFLLAPDWTESNVRTITNGVKAVARGDMAEAELYGKFWTGVVWKGAATTVLANFVLAGGDVEEMKERYDRAWREGNLNWMKVDVTPIYKMTGGETSRRKYYKLMGHFLDPVKWATHPITSVKHKASVVSSMALEFLTGEDWAGRRYTTLEELIKDQQTVTWGQGHSINYDTFPSFVLSQAIGSQPVQVQNVVAWMVGEEEAFDAIAKGMGLGVTTTH